MLILRQKSVDFEAKIFPILYVPPPAPLENLTTRITIEGVKIGENLVKVVLWGCLFDMGQRTGAQTLPTMYTYKRLQRLVKWS